MSAGFCDQKLWGLTFLALERWAGGPGMGLRLLTPISLPNFYPPYVGEGAARYASVPLYKSGWMWLL